MATNAYYRVALTGGGITALDGIDGSTLAGGEFAMVLTGGNFYIYRLNENSAAAENAPYIIAPDTNPGTKRWEQQQIPWVSETGSMFLTSNLVKDPQRLPWYVVPEDDCAVGIDATSGSYTTQLNRMLNNQDFWDTMALVGDVGQVTADDTYATVSSVSGAGILTHLILPGVTNIGDTVSVLVTMDGVETELSFNLGAATDRVISTTIYMVGRDYYDTPGFYPSHWKNADMVGGIAYRLEAGGFLAISIDDPMARQYRAPCLRFENSLSVKMKSSDFTTSSKRDYCAAIYTIDQN
jgi:hypothetical protein